MIDSTEIKEIRFTHELDLFDPTLTTKEVATRIKQWDASTVGGMDRGSVLVSGSSETNLFDGNASREQIERHYSFFEAVWRAPNLDWFLVTQQPENVMGCLRTLKYMAEPRNEGLRWWLHGWYHQGMGEGPPPENVLLGFREDIVARDQQEPTREALLKTRMAAHFELTINPDGARYISYLEAISEAK